MVKENKEGNEKGHAKCAEEEEMEGGGGLYRKREREREGVTKKMREEAEDGCGEISN